MSEKRPDTFIVLLPPTPVSRIPTIKFCIHFRRNNNPRGDKKEYVDGWDEEYKWVDTIKNYRTKPIKFELQRRWYGDIELSSNIPAKLFDYRTTEVKFSVNARKKLDYTYNILQHQGTNAKQSSIKLKINLP